MPAVVAPSNNEERCPVCKSTKYLNPRMQFKINPECYHRMCESCIDRIFSQGPAACPVVGCGRTLRKAKFRKQNFEDLTIERECDIRARVAGVLNRREEDFETLRAFNDYQEMKEEIISNLVRKIDVSTTEAKLLQYEKENRTSINLNKAIEAEQRTEIENDEQARLRRSAEARETLIREVRTGQEEREAINRAVVDSIRNAAGDPEEAARSAQRVQLKKSSGRRSEAQKDADVKKARGGGVVGTVAPGESAGPGLSFSGLKKEVIKEPEKPYDPFGGFRLITKYYELQDSYDHPWLENAKHDPKVTAGGYDVREYYSRAMSDAHAGLGVIVSKEKTNKVTSSES